MPLLKAAHHGRFSHIAAAISRQSGRPSAFFLASATILVWGAVGPYFRYSDTWQLVINTSTTIITFLMVFLIQNTQNRDTAAVQLKLDELIRVNRNARDVLIRLEDLDEEDIQKFRDSFMPPAKTRPHGKA
jgi:low affinity Fe/Cu permease